MKLDTKKKVLIICIVVIVIAWFVVLKMVNSSSDANKEIIFAGEHLVGFGDKNYYLFTDYEEYRDSFDGNLTSNDFEKYNYLFISIKYDSCAEKDVKVDSYDVDGEKININVSYRATCGGCAHSSIHYFLKVGKNVKYPDVKFNYKAINKVKCDSTISKKPMIYLYPEKRTDVSVRLVNDSYLTTTYPKYNKSWEVIAYPNGKLIDKTTGRELYGLYWEGDNHLVRVEEDGFVVNGEDTLKFLEEKLSILGLTEREADEFIIYWLPKLEHNKYNYIKFESIEKINNYMPLEINPKPDTLIRVLMNYKPLDKKIEVKEQKLIKNKREGFTVVEWGGSLIP